jgi:hypothetical protein
VQCRALLSEGEWKKRDERTFDIRLRTMVVIAVVAILAVQIASRLWPATTVAALPPKGTISAKDYGAQWPFPAFSTAILRCTNFQKNGYTRPVITVELGGKVFGLNGAAQSFAGYPDAKTQMARDPRWGSYMLGATYEFLATGLEECG